MSVILPYIPSNYFLSSIHLPHLFHLLIIFHPPLLSSLISPTYFLLLPSFSVVGHFPFPIALQWKLHPGLLCLLLPVAHKELPQAKSGSVYKWVAQHRLQHSKDKRCLSVVGHPCRAAGCYFLLCLVQWDVILNNKAFICIGSVWVFWKERDPCQLAWNRRGEVVEWERWKSAGRVLKGRLVWFLFIFWPNASVLLICEMGLTPVSPNEGRMQKILIVWWHNLKLKLKLDCLVSKYWPSRICFIKNLFYSLKTSP